MAELKPYQPSLRDRLAQMLMGDADAGSARGQFVSGLTGSTGLGMNGPGPGGTGLADFVPGGQVFAMDEAARDANPQDFAIAMMPGSGLGRKAALANKIRAFHGSPHDFDRFDLSKIGSGEGAQAYGHGLYFAESEGVAKSYRDALARGKMSYVDGQHGSSLPQDQWEVADYMASRNLDADGYIAHRQEQIKSAIEAGNQNRAETLEELLQGQMPAIEALRGKNIEWGPAGRMYEVEIDADPAQFLDWDAPLSQQSAKIQEALTPRIDQARRAGAGISADPEGSTLYRLAHPQSGLGDEVDWSRGLQAQATDRLAEQGIPGIKYLDAGSRAAGDGSRNYVTFRDDIVKILRKYGVGSVSALPPAVLAQLALQQSGEAPPADDF